MPIVKTSQEPTGQSSTRTEPPQSRLARIRRWLGENLWLVIGCAVVLMIAPSAAREAETPAMRQHRVQIENMTQTQRDLLLSNFDAWRKIPQKDRDRLREMHNVVAWDNELSETLTEFHTWLAGVSSDSYEFRDRILKEKDPRKRLRMIEGHLHGQPTLSNGNSYDSPDGSDAYLMGLQRGPVLFGRDFEAVMEVIARWAEAPEVPANRTPVTVFKYHIEVIDRAGTKIRNLRSADGPVRVPEELVVDILDAIGTRDRRDEIAVLVGDNPTALLMLLLRSVRAEDMRQIVMTNRPMLNEFYRSLPAPRQKFLDQMPEKERVMRLAWMWAEDNVPATLDLMKRFLRGNRDPGQGRFSPGARRPGQIEPRRPILPNENRELPVDRDTN